MSDKEEMMQDDDFSPDELIVRKKKTPEMRTGVTAESILKTTADALETLAEGDSPNGKPMKVWQEYWAGTDPNDPNHLFRANIVVSNDVPYISWYPDLSVTGDPKRVYHVLCAPTPSAREWVVWPGPGDSGASTNRFFKVELDWEESRKN